MWYRYLVLFGKPVVKLLVAMLLANSFVFAAHAETEIRNVEVQSGAEIRVKHFAGQGKAALLWLPSEYGVRAGQDVTAAALASLGYEVWMADLHTAYFVAPGRESIQEFPVADVVELAEKILAAGKETLFLMASGKGAGLALQTAREMQLRAAGRRDLRGLLLLSPFLYQGSPKLGEDNRFLSVVHETNLPVLVLQPTLSEKYWRVEELVEALEVGGSPVTYEEQKGVQSGFEARSADDLSDAELSARRELPARLHHAMAKMAKIESPKRAAASRDPENYRRQAVAEPRLAPYRGPQDLPDIELDDLQGNRHRLSAYRGKVVLINFWATWCPPCVKEIPSLNELNRRMANRDFQLLTINVGEQEAVIRKFLEQHPVDFPVLLDSNGEAIKSWKVYAYPSNYLLDGNGRIHYGYYGALDWVAPDVIDLIQTLLEK
ncbi:MAG: TlpA family protein disulfide reductase [Proteobacteria bacterium]|nr:MAG: TlpA family protein disulfide reductase [Pseudomonadota bacterium]QKK11796.1 MAG: redoxin domain-containing protein [Pseudomonadota bacterium]